MVACHPTRCTHVPPRVVHNALTQLSTSQARVGCLEAQLQVLRDENAKLVQLLRDAQKLLGDAHKLELQALQRQ